MLISERRAEPKAAQECVQGRLSNSRARSVVVPLLAALLGGCSTLSALNPVNWWHDAEGGKIAEKRQPPPGSTDAEPNLGSVPARPAPPDREAMRQLTRGLIADRENARYAGAAAPLADPSSPAASPGLFGAGTLPAPVRPAAPAAARASLSAASAPPSDQPAAPPSPAPRKGVASAPLASPEPLAEPPAGAPLAAPADLPPLPNEPPPRPGATAEPATPPASVPLAPAPQPAGRDAASLSFDPGSPVLTPATEAAVKQFAAHRNGHAIALTGYGDATSSMPEAQATALSLAGARAKAVASALQAAGVPASAIQLASEAAGRGVYARLLQ